MTRKKGHNNKFDNDRARQIRFLKRGAWFCLLAITGNVCVYLLTKGGWLFYFEIFTARLTGMLLTLSGLQPVLQDNMLRYGASIWLVDTECTAINLITVFGAFILAYPASIKEKSLGIILGLPFIVVANILRLVAMIWVAALMPFLTKYFHDYIWQVVFLIMISFMWLYWIDRFVHHAAEKQVSG